ncbi:MAG: hypothetical protein WCI76_03215 [bacterium]
MYKLPRKQSDIKEVLLSIPKISANKKLVAVIKKNMDGIILTIIAVVPNILSNLINFDMYSKL